MEDSEQRSLAANLYNASKELLAQASRSDDDNVTLLTKAFASRFHWSEVGGPQQLIIGDWLISRAAAATGFSDLSIFFALRTNLAAQNPSTPDWLVASAAEGLARAYASAGDVTQRNEWHVRATELVARIASDPDRQLIADQLATVPA